MKNPSVQCQTCAPRNRGVFCDLSAEYLSQINASKVTNKYSPRQVIFYDGNNPYGLYCVCSGKVKIFKMDSEGHQQIVRLAGPGDIMGYRCLLSNEPYMATAETIEESEICFIDKTTFTHILETHPKTAFHVMSALAHDLGNAEGQILNIVRKNVRERLAALLLTFKAKYGENGKQGVKLNISLTREELAELIGTSQESVI